MIGKYQHSMREQASAHDADMQRLKKVHASSEDNHRTEVRALEERVQRLSAQVDSETLLRRQSDERAAKYDTTHTALQTTTAQVGTFCGMSIDSQN